MSDLQPPNHVLRRIYGSPGQCNSQYIVCQNNEYHISLPPKVKMSDGRTGEENVYAEFNCPQENYHLTIEITEVTGHIHLFRKAFAENFVFIPELFKIQDVVPGINHLNISSEIGHHGVVMEQIGLFAISDDHDMTTTCHIVGASLNTSSPVAEWDQVEMQTINKYSGNWLTSISIRKIANLVKASIAVYTGNIPLLCTFAKDMTVDLCQSYSEEKERKASIKYHEDDKKKRTYLLIELERIVTRKKKMCWNQSCFRICGKIRVLQPSNDLAKKVCRDLINCQAQELIGLIEKEHIFTQGFD